MPAIPLSDALFSATQLKVLGLLYGKPDQNFYANEIACRAQVGKGSLMCELKRNFARPRLQVAFAPAVLATVNGYIANQTAAHCAAVSFPTRQIPEQRWPGAKRHPTAEPIDYRRCSGCVPLAHGISHAGGASV